VVRGRVLRNATYFAQRVEVQRFEIVRIWEGRRVSRVRESDGRRGWRGGQFGGVCCWAGVVVLGSCFVCFVDFDLAIFFKMDLDRVGRYGRLMKVLSLILVLMCGWSYLDLSGLGLGYWPDSVTHVHCCEELEVDNLPDRVRSLSGHIWRLIVYKCRHSY
jgi:hypothetical protein